MSKMKALVFVLSISLALPAVFWIGWEEGRKETFSEARSFEACETKHGYAVRYRLYGQDRTVAFRFRPVEYFAYCVTTWDIEGWDPDYADALLMELPDEIVNVVDPKPSRR